MKPKLSKSPKDRVIREGAALKSPRNYRNYEDIQEDDGYIPAKFSNKNRKKGRGKSKIKKMKD